MIKKELQQELNRTKLVLDYARQEIEEKDKEIERLHSIMKEVREYIENVETLATIDKVNIFSISTLKSILDKGSDKE